MKDPMEEEMYLALGHTETNNHDGAMNGWTDFLEKIGGSLGEQFRNTVERQHQVYLQKHRSDEDDGLFFPE